MVEGRQIEHACSLGNRAAVLGDGRFDHQLLNLGHGGARLARPVDIGFPARSNLLACAWGGGPRRMHNLQGQHGAL